MKILLTFVMLAWLGTPPSILHGQQPHREFPSVYIATVSNSQSDVWRFDMETETLENIFSLPNSHNLTFFASMPQSEIDALNDFNQQEDFFEEWRSISMQSKPRQWIRDISVSPDQQQVAVRITRQICYLQTIYCFGVTQIMIFNDTNPNGRVIWEHAYHDPNLDFWGQGCQSPYWGNISETVIYGWATDNKGIITMMGGSSCFVNNDHPLILVSIDGKHIFHLVDGSFPINAPHENAFATVTRNGESLDKYGLTIVKFDIERETVTQINYPFKENNLIAWGRSGAWMEDRIIVPAVSGINTVPGFLSIDQSKNIIEFVESDNFIAPQFLLEDVFFGITMQGMLATITLDSDEILQSDPIIDRPIIFFRGSSDNLLLVQFEYGTQYFILNTDGDQLTSFDLEQIFTEYESFNSAILDW